MDRRVKNAIDTVIKLESRHAKTRDAIKAAEDQLKSVLLDGEDGERFAAEISNQRAKLVALANLIEGARRDAAAVINARKEKIREDARALDLKVKATMRERDRQFVREVAGLAKRFGIRNVTWPSEWNAGTLVLPVLALSAEEIAATARSAQDVPVDPKTEQLDALRFKLNRLNSLATSSGEEALDQLLYERRGQR